jgi:arginine/lysine/ornithine decarboxylase
VDLGDLLIHEGAAAEAQKYAASVFGADKTYFVLNGTSTSNKIVTNAVLRRGDVVLFDRNNHKSLHQPWSRPARSRSSSRPRVTPSA